MEQSSAGQGIGKLRESISILIYYSIHSGWNICAHISNGAISYPSIGSKHIGHLDKLAFSNSCLRFSLSIKSYFINSWANFSDNSSSIFLYFNSSSVKKPLLIGLSSNNSFLGAYNVSLEGIYLYSSLLFNLGY